MAITPVDLSVTNITATSVRLGWMRWTPLQIFLSGQQGAFYIPKPIVNGSQALFQDSAGTTPVTADGDPFGLILDQSQGAVQTTRRNLLDFTEDLSDYYAWGKRTGVTVTPNTDTAPDGALTADTVNSTGNQIEQGVTAPNTGDFVLSVYVKKTESATTYPMVAVNGGGIFAQVILNTNTGVANVRAGVPGAENLAVESDGNYWRLSFSGDFPSDSLDLAIYAAGSTNGTSYSPNTGSAVFWGAQIEAGTVATAYQKITTGGPADLTSGNHAKQGTSAKRPSAINVPPWKAEFNGVDDEITASFPSSLGSDCTIARAVPGTGASILTGQTIGTSYTIDSDFNAFVIVDRALTSAETTQLTAYLNQSSGV